MSPYPEEVPIDPGPSSTCPKISQWLSLYEPSAFQAAASALGLRESKFVCNPLKNRVSVSHTPPALPDISPTGFQTQILWVFIFPVQVSQAGEPDVELRPLAPQWGPLWLWYPSCLWVAKPGVWVLIRPHLCPSYPSQWGLFFISLGIENLFC